MKELSLNILDISENSAKAEASTIVIEVVEDGPGNLLSIRIADDGKGMSPEFLARVTDPFTTTRTTRKVGMGIPLFQEAAEAAGGEFSIQSELGRGTEVRASFELDNIDRMPLGDISSTMVTLIQSHPNIRFLFTYRINENEFKLDTRELAEILGGVSLAEPEVVMWLSEYLEENVSALEETK